MPNIRAVTYSTEKCHKPVRRRRRDWRQRHHIETFITYRRTPLRRSGLPLRLLRQLLGAVGVKSLMLDGRLTENRNCVRTVFQALTGDSAAEPWDAGRSPAAIDRPFHS